MSKAIGLIGMVVVIAVGAYIYTNQTSKNMAGNGAMEVLDKAKDTKEMMEEKGMVSSIKDAMGLGTAMRCVYTMDSNGKSIQSEVIVEGEKFRSTSIIDNTTSYALFDGNDQYIWSSSDTRGMKMSKTCVEEMKQSMPATSTESSLPTMDDAKEFIDMAKDVECSPASETDFSLPKDITFTDQCSMMKDSMRMMEQYKDKMPKDMKMPAQQ